ncbi:MAG: nucleotide exchange factor GrpE [Patescibacteria group bacterium]|nr:nucleotide exchange factor GrpE [Patescibacteria group bacterium]
MSDDIQKNESEEVGDAPKNNESATTEGEENDLQKCERERDEYLSGWQRAKADFINYKKDEMRRFEEIAKYANTALLMDLIPVLDSFDLGIRALEKAGQVEKGVYMIKASLEDTLRRRGLERVVSVKRSLFDPGSAEVVSEVESEEPPGTIIEEIEPAYRLHDKIIRPARVKVSKGKEGSQ